MPHFNDIEHANAAGPRDNKNGTTEAQQKKYVTIKGISIWITSTSHNFYYYEESVWQQPHSAKMKAFGVSQHSE